MSNVFNVLFCIVLISIFSATLIGILKYENLSKPMRLIVISLILTAISESCSYIAVFYQKYQLRCVIYHFYDILNSYICTAYFIFSFKLFYYRKLMWINFIFWPFIGILNIVFFQPLYALNTNMIVVENFIFITLSLFYIYYTLKKDIPINVFKDSNLRMAAIFLFSSSSSFFFWALVDFLYKGHWKYSNYAMYVQAICEIIVYVAMAVTLFYCNKKTEINE